MSGDPILWYSYLLQRQYENISSCSERIMTATRQAASALQICCWSRKCGPVQNAFELTLPEPARSSCTNKLPNPLKSRAMQGSRCGWSKHKVLTTHVSRME